MAAKRSGVAGAKTGPELLDLYFFELRSHLVEAAAIIDRVEAADNGAAAMADERIEKCLRALDTFKAGGGRAERLLNLLSG